MKKLILILTLISTTVQAQLIKDVKDLHAISEVYLETSNGFFDFEKGQTTIGIRESAGRILYGGEIGLQKGKIKYALSSGVIVNNTITLIGSAGVMTGFSRAWVKSNIKSEAYIKVGLRVAVSQFISTSVFHDTIGKGFGLGFTYNFGKN